MKKFFKWFAIVIGGLVILAIIAFQVMKYNTKQHSPEQTISYMENGYNVSLTYSRPLKKEREIFGGLVPYGQVWRTGANEATTFITGTDLVVEGQNLPAGEYTLWTIPKPNQWEVIFNTGQYGWGVNMDGTAQRDPALDAVVVQANAQKTFNIREQFTIEFTDRNPLVMTIAWDEISVDVHMEKK